MDEIDGGAWSSTTPGAWQGSKIGTAKEMNYLKERDDFKKTKTNVGWETAAGGAL